MYRIFLMIKQKIFDNVINAIDQAAKSGNLGQLSSGISEGLAIEKPKNPPSNFAVIGIYMFDNEVFKIIGKLKPSQRGELEITDVNNMYLKKGKLSHSVLEGWWADAGSSIEGWFETNKTAALYGANRI